MKKIFWILFILKIGNIFCFGDGSAYIGLHLGNHSQRIETDVKEQKQKENIEKSWLDHARNFRDRTINQAKNFWKKYGQRQSLEDSNYQTEPVWMYDTFEESEKAEYPGVEQKQKVARELEIIKEKTIWEKTKDTAALWWRTLKTFKHIFEFTKNVPKVSENSSDVNQVSVVEEIEDEKKALKLLESFDASSLDAEKLTELSKITSKLSDIDRSKILQIFKDRQDISRKVLYQQFENIDDLSSVVVKQAMQILLIQARDQLLLKLPKAYDDMEIALDLKRKDQIDTINEFFKKIKRIKSAQDISKILIQIDAVHLDQIDLQSLYQRISDLQHILMIASILDPAGLARGMYGVKVDLKDLSKLNENLDKMKKLLSVKI